MVQAPPKPITLESFLALPETKPASEFIDGQIVQKPMPQGKHSTIQTELATAVNGALKSQKVARAFSELRCTYPSGSQPAAVYGGRSTIPDVSVVTWARIPRDPSGEIANTFSIAPDWTIEILSPDQSQTKVTKNILHCLDHGSAMGWLIDPTEQTIFVFLPRQQPAVFDESEQLLPVPDFTQGLVLKVGTVFGWLLE